MSVVARTVLREQVKEVLLERILRGELRPGDRLVETRIAQELGTSQAPVAFHRAVVEASGNRVLLQAWLALGIEVPTAFGVYWTYFNAMELVEFHVPIMEAIRAGDAARAGAEARAHVRRTEKVIRWRRREGR